jgi:hypothetical protein
MVIGDGDGSFRLTVVVIDSDLSHGRSRMWFAERGTRSRGCVFRFFECLSSVMLPMFEVPPGLNSWGGVPTYRASLICVRPDGLVERICGEPLKREADARREPIVARWQNIRKSAGVGSRVGVEDNATSDTLTPPRQLPKESREPLEPPWPVELVIRDSHGQRPAGHQHGDRGGQRRHRSRFRAILQLRAQL